MSTVRESQGLLPTVLIKLPSALQMAAQVLLGGSRSLILFLGEQYTLGPDEVFKN